MLEIDGAGGGGQVLRSALGLSALTGDAVRVENVRQSRERPGLRPQHLAAVRAVAALCDAHVEGASEGSETLTFEPGPPTDDPVAVTVGTAGSVALVFDATLPLAAEHPVTVTATGGTHVKWAPTVDYVRHVRAPLFARFGVALDLTVERAGFYPAGGGRARFDARAPSLAPVALTERGRLARLAVHSVASESLADADVAGRQADAARAALTDHPVVAQTVRSVPSDSPGSAVLVRAEYEHTVAGFAALGERGKPAEAVAGDAVAAFEAFHDGEGAVDPHMADQVMLPLALAGGRVRIPRVTDHVRTNLAVVRAFGFDLDLEPGPTLVASPGP
ncbi:MAG: RNA 3'-terminal phosphate cyclase [Haloarculaceae archaeon]